MHHGDTNIAHLLGAAFVHRSNLLGAFLLHPGAQLKHAHHFGIVFLRDLHRIANVIEMTMRAQQHVNFVDLLFAFRACRIAHNPRINDDGLAAGGVNAKRRMTEPRDAKATKINRHQ